MQVLTVTSHRPATLETFQMQTTGALNYRGSLFTGAQPSTGIFHGTLMWEFAKTQTEKIKEILLFWQWHCGFPHSSSRDCMETEVVPEHFPIPLSSQGIICLAFKKSKDTGWSDVSEVEADSRCWSSAASLEIAPSGHAYVYKMIVPLLEWPLAWVGAFSFHF